MRWAKQPSAFNARCAPPMAASSGSSNKPKPAAAMTRGRAARGAICHKKPSGVKLCRMATATEVVNGAIIVAPPIAPATDNATAFRVQALDVQSPRAQTSASIAPAPSSTGAPISAGAAPNTTQARAATITASSAAIGAK